MLVNFNQIDHHLYELSVTDIKYTLPDMLSDLHKENWQISKGRADGTFDVYYSDPGTTSSAILNEFHSYFSSDKFKIQILNLLADNKVFKQKCQHTDIDYLAANTELGAIWAKTPHRQNQAPMHNDNMPSTLAHGLIYLIDCDDPNQSTYFLKFDKSAEDSSQHRIKTGFGRGWLVVANDKSMHQAYNNTDTDRFSLRFSLSRK